MSGGKWEWQVASVASATLNCETPRIYQQCQQQIDFKANGQTDRQTEKVPLATLPPLNLLMYHRVPPNSMWSHPTGIICLLSQIVWDFFFFCIYVHIFSLSFDIVVCNCWVAKAAAAAKAKAATEFVVLFAVIYLFYIRFLSAATCWRLTRFAFPWWMKLNYVGHKFQRVSTVES